jgi:hypothetical protein
LAHILPFFIRFDVRGALKRPRTQSEPFPLDSGLHREIRADAATSLRRRLANQSEPDFSHSIGHLRKSLFQGY